MEGRKVLGHAIVPRGWGGVDVLRGTKSAQGKKKNGIVTHRIDGGSKFGETHI